MSDLHSPAFGEADLTNCERELIHLAGSIQPYGVLLVLREGSFTIAQLSANSLDVWGIAANRLLDQPVGLLGGDLKATVRGLARTSGLTEPEPLRCHTVVEGRRRDFEGALHRDVAGGLIVELQLVCDTAVDPRPWLAQLPIALKRFAAAPNLAALADAVAKSFRDMAGYDRVMVYKFDPDGHGKIVAEARDPRLDSLLGHHYPASDIPQRARELYIRNRVRVLVDVNYAPVPLVPQLSPVSGGELDMSLCQLRSMSPLHLQYLKNMGVTATLVVSLVREGRLWGLVAAHHYQPRLLCQGLKAASELMGEVIATRIAAIENYAHAQVAILVRQLEQRLIEATSSEGDWRLALFRNPRTLLQPFEATGAALFHEGDVLTIGEVPSTPELRALLGWVQTQPGAGPKTELPFSCSSVGHANTSLESLTPVASGVLAVRLSNSRADYLMWFRKEQLTSVTWAGDPTKPVIGNDPLELSPRRSFAAWSEIVRGTALPWSGTEILLARAVGLALVDIIVQVHAVRLLIAEDQLRQTRATVQNANEPVLIADAGGRVLFANDAFADLAAVGPGAIGTLDDLAALFVNDAQMRRRLAELRNTPSTWRGEAELKQPVDPPVPVSVRAEIVQGRHAGVLGYMLLFADLRPSKRTLAARLHLEQSLLLAAQAPTGAATEHSGVHGTDEVVGAILTNARLAAMDIADAEGAPSLAPLMEELESSTRRAVVLYAQLRSLSDPPAA